MSINSGRNQPQNAPAGSAGVGVSDIIGGPAGSFSPRRRETLLWGVHDLACCSLSLEDCGHVGADAVSAGECSAAGGALRVC